jgi:hypothetical protein
MVQTKYKVLNAVVLLLLLTVACGFQTSFWFQLTDGAPAPQLWMLIVVYLALYRPYFVAMLMVYAMTFVLKAFSAAPLGILWGSLFCAVSSASYVRSRFFWSTTRYFVMTSGAFCLVFNIVILLLSKMVEENPASISPFTRLIEILLTALFAAPMYWLLLRIDDWTLPEVMETTGVVNE